MEQSEISDHVVKVVCQVLNIDADMVNPESNFVFDLGAKSTQSVQLVAAFEEEFDIEMEGDDALAVQTVGEAAEFIARYVNG